jgi:hypothetical protein
VFSNYRIISILIRQSPLSIKYHQGEKERDGDLGGHVTAMRKLREAFRNLQGN